MQQSTKQYARSKQRRAIVLLRFALSRSQPADQNNERKSLWIGIRVRTHCAGRLSRAGANEVRIVRDKLGTLPMQACQALPRIRPVHQAFRAIRPLRRLAV
jgi:hypothetical protein